MTTTYSVPEIPDVTIIHGDCIEAMRQLPDNSVDSIVTDPPYGLGFMGKAWDDLPPGLPWAQECLRVLKPGGHLLAFGGSRTWHRLAVAVEDAGFEIRDSIAWLYGSGFPKSMDVSKAIDKAAGAKRVVVGRYVSPEGTTGAQSRGFTGTEVMGKFSDQPGSALSAITAPATTEAQQWAGWGTALKPGFEPVVVGRKPLAAKTVAANVLEFGTGALNIDASRIGSDERVNSPSGAPGANAYRFTGGDGRDAENARRYAELSKAKPPTTVSGRWPANVILDESQGAVLDAQSGIRPGFSGGGATPGEVGNDVYGKGWKRNLEPQTYSDTGGASRFFYCAKAPKSERPIVDGTAHPTVKPLSLMRYLVKLVTPPGGIVLEPFAGSGATVEACMLEGFNVIAVEREAEYLPLIQARVARIAISRVESLT